MTDIEKKNALMVQVVFAFAQGCGGTGISDEASAWFHQRYYDWIDTAKPNLKCPRDVWGEHGADFINHFKRIGGRAASNSKEAIESDTLKTEALGYEQELACPYCPDKI